MKNLFLKHLLFIKKFSIFSNELESSQHKKYNEWHTLITIWKWLCVNGCYRHNGNNTGIKTSDEVIHHPYWREVVTQYSVVGCTVLIKINVIQKSYIFCWHLSYRWATHCVFYQFRFKIFCSVTLQINCLKMTDSV